ncbi:DUF305 domain-containing protein [Acetobacterium bakii]|uniref:DUF305 domain-containing protein n=1 Tax=Acetobacterium bakii TaxID=52689 RepID=UPI0006812DF6|nr:DUF305 domain-containing protein [Acetobacterium bakii]
MKKTTLVMLGVLFAVVLSVLLGLVAYTLFSVVNNSISQQNLENGFGGMMGSGVTGSGMMESGMMSDPIESEHDFLVHMIAHHEEAVYAAGILKENTEREEMKQFAEDIIKTQSAEIEQMKLWLETWYPNEDHSVDYQPMMRDLTNLQGDALDKAFLQDMMFHHMDAVMMSQQLITGGFGEHSEIIPFARNIRNTQRNEIFIMRNWLSEWFG